MTHSLRMAIPLAMALSSACLAQESKPAPDSADRAAASAAPSAPSVSGDAQKAAESIEAENPWRFDLNTWLWVVAMDGTVGARGQRADVDASFGDLLEAADSIFAISGRVEAGYGAFGGFIDGMYSKLGVDDQSGPLGVADIDIDFETVMIDFGIMYRLGEWKPSGDAARNIHDTTLDLYAGARYTDLDLTIDPASLPDRTQSVSWFDPIVGAKFVLPLCERWHLAVNGDIGGFGAGSDFTWSSTAVLGYDFHIGSAGATAYAGYRAIGQDYSEGSGANEFIWDVVQHGPILGFALRF
ncbi:MAG: hypothetical protein JNL80_03085 [Phycisphaerae bacterium]|jgi:hypothetical protein|nr:hypothetical protein [Phycisphaerae bacterium]